MELIIRLLLVIAISSTISTNTSAGDKSVFQTLRCDYFDEDAPFSIEANMIDFDRFTTSGFFLSNGRKLSYPLSQKIPQHNEVFYFVLNEGKRENSLEVRVYDSANGMKSTATFFPAMEYGEGTCFFY